MTAAPPTLFGSNLVWLLTSEELMKDYNQQELDETVKRVCKDRDVRYRMVLLEDVVISIENGGLGVWIKGKKVKYFPLVVLVRVPTPVLQCDSEITILRHLELLGCRLMNSSAAILKCVNKVWTFQELANNGFPLPNTFSYGGHSNIMGAVKTVDTNLAYPVVVKNCRGHRGKCVFLARDQHQMHDSANLLRHDAPYLFQQYIRESHGRDVRVVVVGDKVIGAMLRQSTDGRMQSNCSAGGAGQPFTLSPEGEKLAIDVARCLRMDICGVDLLLNNDGSFWVCEVNANVGYKFFNPAMGHNVAEDIAIMALAEIDRLKEIRKYSTVEVSDTSDYYSDTS